MAPQILVALKSEDRLSQMIPYIEKIAQPGMKVVFLIRFSPQTASKASRHNSIELRVPRGITVLRGRVGETEVHGKKFQRDAVDGGAKAIG